MEAFYEEGKGIKDHLFLVIGQRCLILIHESSYLSIHFNICTEMVVLQVMEVVRLVPFLTQILIHPHHIIQTICIQICCHILCLCQRIILIIQ